ncbi:helix-turn-helix transcriptional regulator [Gordonia paraffinivorans]|uniref:helix-turn-helix transcriptional regulator n=1 Tax=Gordonia paraffinivorans TaxID=175628 RepID=UPI001444E59C|nr:helix-turn-helix domain-containing protein [Gordonia paraffinivorans]
MSLQEPPAEGIALPREVAAYVRTTEASLAQDRYQGRGIPYIKAGRRVLYRWEDVHAWLAENIVNPGVA